MKTLSLLALLAAPFLCSCVGRRQPQTPARQLAAAVKSRDKALFDKLLAEGAVPGEGYTLREVGEGFPDAETYADEGDRYMLDKLLSRCADAYVHGRNCFNALPYLARRGDPATLAVFLAKGMDVDAKRFDVSLLHYAASWKNLATAKFLIENGADLDAAIAEIDDLKAYHASTNSDHGREQVVSLEAAGSFLRRLRREGKRSPAGVPAPAAEIISDVDAPTYKAAANADAFAVVVGVEKYNALPDARFAERDAKAMSAHLLAMGYPQRNIVLLTGAQATRTGIVKNLEAWLPNQVSERSTVLFYFSGHGAPDAKTSQAYLVPMDGDPQYLEETAYPIKRLYAKLAVLKARRVLVALDSCFSGAGGRSVLAQGTRPLVAKMDIGPDEGDIVSLSASSPDEITGALEEQGHGLFTYHLLKALTETAGRGTVAEVYSALKPRVQDEARRQNRAQTPRVFGQSLDGGLR